MDLWNRATRTIGPEGNEGESITESEASMDSGKGVLESCCDSH